MRKILAAIGAALALTGAAQAATFTVVEGPSRLPSHEIPNGPGDIAVPAEISTPPSQPARLTYEELLGLWRQAGEAYGVPWETLAAINQIESDFGRNMGPSYAGAVGWMQFLPSTWERWGLDASGDGVADPWNPTDAAFSAARYLAASGAHEDLPGAIWSYNHSQDYVDEVLSLSSDFLANPLRAKPLLGSIPITGPSAVEQLERYLTGARERAARVAERIVSLEGTLAQSAQELLEAEQRTGDPSLNDAAFKRAQRDVLAIVDSQSALEAELAQARVELASAEEQVLALEEAVLFEEATPEGHVLEPLIGRAPTAKAASIVDWATRQLGIPYQWGGNHGFSLEQMVATDPSIPAGFDCSSLLAWAYAKGAGIYIGDFTGTQWDLGGTSHGALRGEGPARGGGAPPGGYQTGDLIFFNATNHVGMYLGNDLFIHAPHTGDVVRVARLSDYPLEVWGWVRWQEVAGPTFGSNPDAGRVFEIVARPAAETGEVLTFTR
jgi:cell wall-associated NlpC family hydrolase